MKRESINPDCSVRSSYNLSAKVLVSVVGISIAALAFGAGVSTRTRRQPMRLPHAVGASLSLPATGRSLPDANIPPGYAPIGIIKYKGDLFAKVELQNAPEAESPGPGGGAAEIFDRDGRLVKRFIAVERPNSTWEVIEDIRLSAIAPSAERPEIAPAVQPIAAFQHSRETAH
jgi:hypothetical protein